MEKNKFLSIASVLFLFLITLSSCVSPKEIIYLQDINPSLQNSAISNYDTKILNDDILKIIVSSENMESVQPFNHVIGMVTDNTMRGNGQGIIQSYLVDQNGDINYPLLGKVKAAGLSRVEFQEKLQLELTKYVKDALVDVRIINYKVTVIGEVNKPGTFNIEDNRITLLQAIGLAGDLSIYGKRDNVLVLRDINGVQQATRVDLTSSDFIYSPYYYLSQNDTVIVEPNGAQVQAAGFNRNISIYVSIASVILSTVAVLSNLNR